MQSFPVRVADLVEPSPGPGATLETFQETNANNSDRTFESDYDIHTKLRSGSYGTVYTTRHKTSKEEFAVKVIDRYKLKEKDDSATFREISIMKDLIGVANIVKLVDVYVTPKTFHIVQFYAKGGDVFDRLAKRVSYSEQDARFLSVALMKTMREMHDLRICHRDMKPENLLLKSPHDDSSILLADFGFAKYVPDHGLKTRCGTPAFVAPEILVGKSYGTQADMWSIGCLIYMLIGGYPPFQDETHRGLFRKIRGSNFTFHQAYWSNVSMPSKQLITNLLTVDPDERLDASACLASQWCKESEESLSSRDLSGSIRQLKSFNARRTFRSAVQAVQIAAAFQVEKIADLMKETDKHVEEEQEFVEVSIGGTVSPPEVQKLNMSLTKKKKFAELYEVMDKLQRGSTSVVKKCYSKVHHKEFAVKIIERDEKTDEHVLQEVTIMNHLHHENIVAVVDFFEEEDFYYIVMELMAGGDVFDRVIDLHNYTEKDARDLAKILLLAVDYMHRSGVVHRDIKPQNIFLESNSNNSAIKVGDFGFAKRVHTPKSLNQRCGTPSYVAPEILKNHPYDQSCDMWSVGVVLYVMLCGYTPFVEEQQEKMFERIKVGDYSFDPEDWHQISDEAKVLIKGLMCTNPDRRLSAGQALRSKWITGCSDMELSRRSLVSQKNLMNIKKNTNPIKDVALGLKRFKIKAKAELKKTIDTSLKVTEKLTVAATSHMSS